jgi:hypothetical protein
MTTIRITAADVGLTLARDGVWSEFRFLVADRNMFRNITIVDDAPPFDVVPEQLFNCDMLSFATNKNGALPSPFVVFEDASIAFGNLTIAACPADAVFEVDCTGALTWAEIEEARRLRAERAKLPPPLPQAPPTYTPPENYVEVPPPPPDPEIVAAHEEARRQWEAQKNWAVRGKSLAEIETALLIAVRRQQEERRAGEIANALLQEKLMARAAAQAEATRLLQEAGFKPRGG